MIILRQWYKILDLMIYVDEVIDWDDYPFMELA